MSKVKELQCSYSTISTEELVTKVIPDYCIEDLIDCQFWERGSTDTYVVRCAKARYSLRIYRNELHTRDEVDFEVDALNYLHNNGFPVAFPIARKSGEFVTEILAPEGIRYVLVTAFAEGEEPEYDSLKDFRLTGESVAKLHQVSDGFETPHKRKEIDLELFTDINFKTIEPFVSHRPKDLAFLKECIETSRTTIEQVGADTMDFGFCHGDVHGGNAHLHEGVLRHFDFEECGFGFRVFDLATFKWAFLFNNKAPERWAAFVEGYESVRKITEADTQLLDTFVLLRHIWLIAFHMRNADDFGSDLISDKYIDRQWRTLKRLCCEGIGVELKKENGYIEVVSFVAGGTAAKSRQLSAGDRIVGVGGGDDGDMTDIRSLSLDEVTDLIPGPKGTTVRLEILPADAPDESHTKVVALVREKYTVE